MPTRDARGRLVHNKDSSFFNIYGVSTTDFNVVANWDFNSTGIGLMVESNNVEDVVLYSFNGRDVHGSLNPTFPSEAIMFDNRVQNRVWLKRATPGDTVKVHVHAWRHMA